MDLLIDTKGAALRKRRNRLVVAVDGQRHEYAIDDVEQVVLGPGVSVTTDALLLAAEHGTDVVLTDWRDDPRGRFLTGGLMGAALTKRNQLAAMSDRRGVQIAWELARAKCSQPELWSAPRVRLRPGRKARRVRVAGGYVCEEQRRERGCRRGRMRP